MENMYVKLTISADGLQANARAMVLELNINAVALERTRRIMARVMPDVQLAILCNPFRDDPAGLAAKEEIFDRARAQYRAAQRMAHKRIYRRIYAKVWVRAVAYEPPAVVAAMDRSYAVFAKAMGWVS